MNRWAFMAGIGLMAGALVLPVLGRAQGEEEGGPWRGQGHRMGPQLLAMLENERVRTELGLTDQQADRLHQIAVEAKKSSVKTQADIAVRGIELREMLRADKPDREAVMKRVQEISELRGQLMKQHIESFLAAKSVLTPEQQKKMRALMEHRRRPDAGPGWLRPRPPRAPEGPPEPSARAPEGPGVR